MKNVRVARRYAMALMEAAEEQDEIERTTKDLDLLDSTLRGSRELRVFLASPIVSAKRKTLVAKELFETSVGRVVLAFVSLMIAKNRARVLADVIEEFKTLRDEKMGIVNVDVKAAVELGTQQEKDLRARLERYTRKKVRVRFALDKVIRGGLVVKIGDTVLDGSIKRQLELLRERFVLGGPLSN